MIRLERIRTKKAVPAAFRGAKRIERALTLLVPAGNDREFDSGYWKGAKPQLKAEAAGKCAYCEAPTAVVAHGDVEHFRPKSVYWWLAYCYDNYLFSCQICNQSFKKDEFPLQDPSRRLAPPAPQANATPAGLREFVRRFAPDPLDADDGMSWSGFQSQLSGEDGSLLNPYVDDPETHFAWEADAALQEVSLRPLSPASRRFIDAAITYFGLNRPELRLERWKTFRKLDVFHKALENPSIDAGLRAEIAAEIQAMMAADAPFAGMCRHFVRRVWNLGL